MFFQLQHLQRAVSESTSASGPAYRRRSRLPIEIGVGRGVPVAVQPGWQQTARPGWTGGRLREAHHAGRAPHLDGGVITGGKQQLLVGRAEGH